MAKVRSISAYLCDCGDQLSNRVDFKKIVEDIKKWPEVADVKKFSNLCAREDLESMLKNFKESDSERFVVGACTPQRLEIIIRNFLEEKGLNPYIFDISNLREQCAWVHRDVEKASHKASALLRSGVGRAVYLEKIGKERYDIGRNVIIVGGGIAGLQASIDLASLGYNTTILEKNSYLGGHVVKLHKIYPQDLNGSDIIEEKLRLAEDLGIKFLKNCEINSVKGTLGNFHLVTTVKPTYVDPSKCDLCGKCEEVCPVTISSEYEEGLTTVRAIYRPVLTKNYIILRHNCPPDCKKCVEFCPKKAIDLGKETETKTLSADALVFATGYEVFKPEGFYNYKFGNTPNVITQLQLTRMLDPSGPTLGKLINLDNGAEAKSIVMVQCVGSRDVEFKFYCSELCCMIAVRHAVEIKERYPGVDVHIVYIDMRTFYDLEKEYRKARSLGVDFIRGRVGDVFVDNSQVNIEVFDSILLKHIMIPCDLLVLSTAFIPDSGNNRIFSMLNLDFNDMGFVRELYEKVRRVDTVKKGVYVCGGTSGPKHIRECISEAHAVALRLHQDLREGVQEKYLVVTTVDENNCNGCGLCERICPFKVPLIIEKDEGELKALIDSKICRGCGTCTSVCPTGAVQLQTHSRDQTINQIQYLLKDHGKTEDPIIVGFVCEECGYATADMAGMTGLLYPENVRLIRLPCAGRLSLLDILKTFEYGAQAVFLACCASKGCHYLEGDAKAKIQIEIAKEILDSIGWDSRRVEIYQMFSAEPNKFVEAVEEMNRRVKELGPTTIQ